MKQVKPKLITAIMLSTVIRIAPFQQSHISVEG